MIDPGNPLPFVLNSAKGRASANWLLESFLAQACWWFDWPTTGGLAPVFPRISVTPRIMERPKAVAIDPGRSNAAAT